MNNFWLDLKEAKDDIATTVEAKIEKMVGHVIWLDDPYVGRDAPLMGKQDVEWDTDFDFCFDINACADGVKITESDWELDM